MSGGQTFTGVTGATYTATPGALIEVGPGDVRMALMMGWVQPDEVAGGTWSGSNKPDMLTVKLADIERRLSALETQSAENATREGKIETLLKPLGTLS
jgi:FtsP/CotA-like multicopper oxidase with cupredoxin domain